MFEDIGTLLTSPDRFFEGRTEDPSLLEPAFLVFGLVIINAISGAVTIYYFMDAIPQDVQLFVLIGGAVGVIFGAVGPVIAWLLYALAFQIITYFFGGEGEFRDTFAVTGWGFAPRIFGAILSLVVTVYVLQTLQLGNPSDLATFNQQLANQSIHQAVNAAIILFTLWSAYIWVPAVQRVRNVTRGQAIVAVAIPVLLSILMTVAGLLFSTMAQGNV